MKTSTNSTSLSFKLRPGISLSKTSVRCQHTLSTYMKYKRCKQVQGSISKYMHVQVASQVSCEVSFSLDIQHFLLNKVTSRRRIFIILGQQCCSRSKMKNLPNNCSDIGGLIAYTRIVLRYTVDGWWWLQLRDD